MSQNLLLSPNLEMDLPEYDIFNTKVGDATEEEKYKVLFMFIAHYVVLSS